MGEPAAYDHRRYLAAKASVDDRARNRRVEERLVDEPDTADPLSVLEVGAGLGNALERLLSLGLPVAEYTTVDSDPETVAAARERVPDRLEAAGYAVLDRDPLRLRSTARSTTCYRRSRRADTGTSRSRSTRAPSSGRRSPGPWTTR